MNEGANEVNARKKSERGQRQKCGSESRPVRHSFCPDGAYFGLLLHCSSLWDLSAKGFLIKVLVVVV